MNVIFKSAQTLGNRPFKAGQQIVPDHLSGNVQFKQLVKAGTIVMVARDAAAMKLQASKDSMNAKKAEVHRKLGGILTAARLVPGAKPHDVTEIAKPGTAAKIAADKAEKEANKKSG